MLHIYVHAIKNTIYRKIYFTISLWYRAFAARISSSSGGGITAIPRVFKRLIQNSSSTQTACRVEHKVIDLSNTAPFFSKEWPGKILQSVIKIPLYPPLQKGDWKDNFLKSTPYGLLEQNVMCARLMRLCHNN